MTIASLWKRFRVKRYRQAFSASQLKRGMPFQIRAMRNKFGWSQAELAEKAGLTQGAISRAENPSYGDLSFNTILKIANGLDVAFVGRFVPYSELSRWYDDLSEQSAQVLTFEEEDTEFRGSATVPIQQRVFSVSRRSPENGDPQRKQELALTMQDGTVLLRGDEAALRKQVGPPLDMMFNAA